MDARIHDQRIAAFRQRTHARHTRQIPRHKHMTGFLPQKRRQRLFQLDVIRTAAVGQARSTRARTPAVKCLFGRRDHLRVPAQTKVFIGRHQNHLLAVDGDVDAIGRVHDTIVGRVFQPLAGRGIGAATIKNRLGFFLKKQIHKWRVVVRGAESMDEAARRQAT